MAADPLPTFSGVTGSAAGANSGLSVGGGCLAKVVQPCVSLRRRKALILGYFKMAFNVKTR